jgi:hypothetical protein
MLPVHVRPRNPRTYIGLCERVYVRVGESFRTLFVSSPTRNAVEARHGQQVLRSKKMLFAGTGGYHYRLG